MADRNIVGEDAAIYARDFGDIKVSAIGERQLLSLVHQCLVKRSRLDITFLNPDYARRAFLDAGLRDRIGRFDLVLADGHGIRLLAPLFGFRIRERLDTDSVAPKLFTLLNERRGSVFLFGSKPGVAEQAAANLAAHFPRVAVAGTEHGFHDVERGHPGWFEPEDSDRIVSEMNRSGANFVLVSLPTPLQQNWLADYRSVIEATVVMTGGSYIDHMAEAMWPQSWYPAWTTRMKLNWLYRLAKEPQRLWKRYSIEFAGYVLLAIRARLSEFTDGNATAPRRRPAEPRHRSD